MRRRTKNKVPTADEWNAAHPVGVPVAVSPIIGRAAEYCSRTRGQAWTLSNGLPFVKIEGRSGGYFLGALMVLSEAEYAASLLPEAKALDLKVEAQ